MASSPTLRLDWIDLFRALAVLFMIETHVLNTFLAPDLRSLPIFDRLTFFNGLVAPAFLFAAGYLRGLGMHLSGVKSLGRKWGRLAALAALGYALHFPLGALQNGYSVEALRVGSQVDILQCLAVSLAVLLAVQCWAGKAANWILAAALVGSVVAAPYLQQVPGPVPLVAYINASTGSLFPLFPWAGFVFAGALASKCAKDYRELALPLISILVCQLIPVPTPFSAISLWFFVERLTWVLIFAWACKWLMSGIRWPSLLMAGRQSLCMYAVHLILIAIISGAGVTHLGFGQTVLMFGAVLAITWVAAWIHANGPRFLRFWLKREPATTDPVVPPGPVAEPAAG